ncbi:helix-turn-helix domain-containing protein, partial [bacterium]
RFVEATGIPPMRHRCQKRVAAAGELLLYTRLTCAQIAERTGFRDEFHLSRRFRAETGLAPTSYRRQGPLESDRK